MDAPFIQKRISGWISRTFIIKGAAPGTTTFTLFPFPGIIISEIELTSGSLKGGFIGRILIEISFDSLIKKKIGLRRLLLEDIDLEQINIEDKNTSQTGDDILYSLFQGIFPGLCLKKSSSPPLIDDSSLKFSKHNSILPHSTFPESSFKSRQKDSTDLFDYIEYLKKLYIEYFQQSSFIVEARHIKSRQFKNGNLHISIHPIPHKIKFSGTLDIEKLNIENIEMPHIPSIQSVKGDRITGDFDLNIAPKKNKKENIRTFTINGKGNVTLSTPSLIYSYPDRLSWPKSNPANDNVNNESNFHAKNRDLPEGNDIIKTSLGITSIDAGFSIKNDAITLGSDNTSLTASIKAFANDLKSPLLSVEYQNSVEYQKNQDIPSYSSLEFSGNNISIEGCAAEVADILPDNAICRTIFNIIKSGTADEISVSFNSQPSWQSSTSTPNDKNEEVYFDGKRLKLFNPETMKIKGRLSNASIHIPSTALIADKVNGYVNVVKGTLHTDIQTGHIKNATIHNGQLSVDLIDKSFPYTGEFQLSTELANLHQVLMDLITKPSVVSELKNLKNIKGKADGTLKIEGEKNQTPTIVVDANNIDLKGQYLRLPKKFSIKGKSFNYSNSYSGNNSGNNSGNDSGHESRNESGSKSDKKRGGHHLIEVSQISGKMGKSTFSDIAASISFQREKSPDIRFTCNIAEANLWLDEIVPWFKSFEDGENENAKNNNTENDNAENAPGIISINRLTSWFSFFEGNIILDGCYFKGEADPSRRWDYLFRGRGENISFKQITEEQTDQNFVSDLSFKFIYSNSKEKFSEADNFSFSEGEDFNNGNVSSLDTTKNERPESNNNGDFLISPNDSEGITTNPQNPLKTGLYKDFQINRIWDIKAQINDTSPLSSFFKNKYINDIQTPVHLINGSIDNYRDRIKLKYPILFTNNIQANITSITSTSSIPTTQKHNMDDIDIFEIDITNKLSLPNSKPITEHDKNETYRFHLKRQKEANSNSMGQYSFDLKGSLNTKIVKSFFKSGSTTLHDIEQFTQGKTFIIESTPYSPASTKFKVYGKDENFDHYKITTDSLDLDFLINLMSQFNRNGNKNENPFLLPLLTLETDTFMVNKIALNPFRATFNLNGNEKKIVAETGHNCHINTTAFIKLKPDIVDISILIDENNNEIEPVMTCLYEGEKLMDGRYSVKGFLNTNTQLSPSEPTPSEKAIPDHEALSSEKPNPDNKPLWSEKTSPDHTKDKNDFHITEIEAELLKQNLTGNFQISAQDGRIFRLTLLSRILSIINISRLMEGKFPDIEQTGFAYSTIEIDALVKKNKIILKKAVVNGLDMTLLFMGWIDPFNKNMELNCLVAPFKTADNIIKKIPLIGRMLNDRLIAIPVKAWGPINDPSVIIMHPSDVGKSIINSMESILTAPFEIIENLKY
ncbi:hypothetical protein MTBBW1_130001 [Desulfamplus magnetovallimortis]|uniref:Uncharacterized protein n=1 Tax=Desulfamplus magnetovallimortis TaxID=1246637 RepID=A0A1W1H734_9BACT|nr:AsmA-like C-terminal domain-containing protein [Desulfamplus magnetovallimortis]SLM28246.1 hypothetical protein MTBBW1_130001 [Desulfamplus magnetovallimortis]